MITCIPLSVSFSHPKRLNSVTAVNLLGASFSIVPEDAFITHEVDKSTFLHKTGSMATSLHLRQTLDILKCKENIIHTTAALITGYQRNVKIYRYSFNFVSTYLHKNGTDDPEILLMTFWNINNRISVGISSVHPLDIHGDTDVSFLF